MKKTFTYYSICWLIALAVFNVIVFITSNEILGSSKFTGAFWAGYIFITLTFIGQLACSYKAFKAENLKKLFYNIPLISVSYAGLIAILIAGAVCMAVPFIPYWVGIIVCLLIFAFSAVNVIKATVLSDIVNEVDGKIERQTQFIKLLTADAEHLMLSSSTELATETKKVYEAIRYSDPISNNALSDIENQIQDKFTLFTQAVETKNTELAKAMADNLINIIDSRNKKCKALK